MPSPGAFHAVVDLQMQLDLSSLSRVRQQANTLRSNLQGVPAEAKQVAAEESRREEGEAVGVGQ